jgi:hypothetical protein
MTLLGADSWRIDCHLSLDERYERKGNLRRHNDTLGTDCMGCRTIVEYLREKSFSKSRFDSDIDPKIQEENFIDEATLGIFKKCPFS